MKKKEQKTEIATNVSSGAKKVETVVKKKQMKTTPSARGDAALGDSAKQEKGKVNATMGRAEKESAAAKARVELALKKKEEKEKRKQERAKKKEEKAELRRKKLAEKNAIAEKRAKEREERQRERAHAKANRNQANARKRKEKKNNRESRAKGYGGWIAAVVTLGVTTLALATTVTVGALEMNEMKSGMANAQMGTMYELTGVMEHVDDDLDRVRISASPTQQGRILTDLLVQARLAEADLEKLPIPMEADRNVTEFVNRTAKECERMLAKLRAGESLSERDFETLEGLYKTNHSIRVELDKLVSEMTDKDLMDYVKDGTGMLSNVLNNLENITLEENRAAWERKMKGAGMETNPPKTENGEGSAIDIPRAEELCRTYFSKYAIDEYQCVGETVARSYTAYNMQGFDENGRMLFAEIDRNSGNLVTFDYFEDCSADTFDLQNARIIAEEFLSALGYEDLEVVRVSETGTTADFTFVYEEDGVAYYPDTVHVKVCRSRGIVSGLDATKYLKNHRGRDAVNPKITMETAREKLHEKLSVEAARLTVVDTARGEKLAYEFLCSYDEDNYFVYLNADTGEEIAILNTQNVR